MAIVMDKSHFEGWTTDKFLQELTTYRSRFQQTDHPLIRAIRDGSLSREGVETFLIQFWYFGAVAAESVLPRIVSNMPVDPRLYPIKQELVKNIYGELFDPAPHPEVNLDMICKAFGTARDDIYRREVLSETSSFCAVLRHYGSQSWQEGLMATTWGLESQGVDFFGEMSKAMRGHYAFEDTKFLDMHVMMDADHTREADEFARQVIDSDNMLDVWNAVCDTLRALWIWYDQMYVRLVVDRDKSMAA